MPYEGLSSDGCFFSSVGEMWVVLARSLAWLDLDIPKTLPEYHMLASKLLTNLRQHYVL